MRAGSLTRIVGFAAAIAVLGGLLFVRVRRAGTRPEPEIGVTAGASTEVHPWPSSSNIRLKTEGEGTREGDTEARADVAAGVLGWRTLGGWGLPPPPPSFKVVSSIEVLERDFGVKIKSTEAGSGCMPPPDEPYLRGKLDAYNAIMKPLIEAKHGADVFTIAEQRAEKETASNKAAFEKKQAEPQKKDDKDCTIPFWTDKDGTKKYKPACI